MLSLLLKSQKEELRREYFHRLLNVFLTAIFFVVLVWIIGLLPSYIAISSEKNELSGRARIALNSQLAEDKRELLALSTNLSEKLKVFSGDTRKSPTGIINAITDTQLPTIAISTISMAGLEGENPAVSVNGIARNREGLKGFVDALNSQGMFERVDLPLSNFVKESEIPFTIDLVILPSKATSE